MIRTLVVRGALAGVVAGLAAFAVGLLFVEPDITLGLASGTVLFGVVAGVLLALVYAIVHGRVGRLTPRATAAVTALGGFVTMFLTPFVKYPSNPPGATDPATITQRTDLYGLAVVLSVVTMVGAVLVWRRIVRRIGTWNAALLGAAVYVVTTGAVDALLPAFDEVPAGFPASALYDFRMASLGGEIVLWAVLGLVFGALIDGRSRRLTHL